MIISISTTVFTFHPWVIINCDTIKCKHIVTNNITVTELIVIDHDQTLNIKHSISIKPDSIPSV